jgi:hypothetical protein
MSLTQQEASRALDFLRRLGEAALYAAELSEKAGGLVGLEDQVKDALRRLVKAQNEHAQALHDIKIERDRLNVEKLLELKIIDDERQALKTSVADTKAKMASEAVAHNDTLVLNRQTMESERQRILGEARASASKIIDDAQSNAVLIRQKIVALEQKHNELLAKHLVTQKVVDDMNSHLLALRK